MTPARTAALLLAALGIATLGALWLWPGAEAPLVVPGSASTTNPTADRAALTPPPAVADELVLPREAATAPRRTEPPTAAACAQGLRGLVVDEAGLPLADIAVHLLESAANDPLAQPTRPRDALAPLATVHSDVSGRFAIGLPVVQDRQYELCCASARHALQRIGPYRLLAGEWHDLGAITLLRGATLRGRVTVAGRDDIPVPRATVRLEIGASFADAVMGALADDAPGSSVLSDANGHYELAHAPSRGIVQVSAAAPGFARVLQRDVVLRSDAPVQIDFALPPGQSVLGQVVDELGAPIAGARLQAFPLRAPTPPLSALSDERGQFAIHGLLPETYRATAFAANHEPAELNPVAPGSSDLRFVLRPRAAVNVRVRTPTGETVRGFRIALRRWFESPPRPPQIGAVPEVPEHQVRLGPGSDQFVLDNLPNGVFVCEVEADGFAKTWSQPIDNRRDAALPRPARWHEVEIVLTLGATLRGRVVDDGGAPLAGAVVTTLPDDAQPDSSLFRLLAGAVPTRTTNRIVRTDVDGRFELPQLTPATYLLVVEHADACRELVHGVPVVQGVDRTLPTVALRRGAIVTGRATQAGRLAGQIKVVLTPAGDAGQRGGQRLEATTDGQGRFRLPARVPPGEYVLRGAVVDAAEPEAQIARQLLQLQRSSTTVSVPPGQDSVERDLDLPPDR